jgi:anaerobic C4-dicarboxylate transporter
MYKTCGSISAQRRATGLVDTSVKSNCNRFVSLVSTNGTQIAAANFDLSGTTTLGTKLLDHSYFIPVILLSLSTGAAGSLIAVVFF